MELKELEKLLLNNKDYAEAISLNGQIYGIENIYLYEGVNKFDEPETDVIITLDNGDEMTAKDIVNDNPTLFTLKKIKH